MGLTFGFKFHRVSLSKCLFCLYCDESWNSALSSAFKLNGRHLQSWYVLDMMWEGTWGGGINQLLQKWTFGTSARAARLWRALSFSDILHAHRKLLYFTDSLDCCFWLLKTHYLKMANTPPHTHTHFTFPQVCLGTHTKF